MVAKSNEIWEIVQLDKKQEDVMELVVRCESEEQ